MWPCCTSVTGEPAKYSTSTVLPRGILSDINTRQFLVSAQAQAANPTQQQQQRGIVWTSLNANVLGTLEPTNGPNFIKHVKNGPRVVFWTKYVPQGSGKALAQSRATNLYETRPVVLFNFPYPNLCHRSWNRGNPPNQTPSPSCLLLPPASWLVIDSFDPEAPSCTLHVPLEHFAMCTAPVGHAF